MAGTGPEGNGSYAAFATGLLGYLLLNTAIALAIWETAGISTGQQVLTWAGLVAPPTALGALYVFPASRRAGGSWLRGLTIGCLGGTVLALAVVVLGALSQ